ncbi:uncharacterized protein CPUR_00497 [Claviceps purpurea 20.1]|uniref:PiggyBac transposable element-derived protein domain-containing protein n=1 Tax=Claviceps purpurea (strain 20.1) TaxID=1111077 RepID=M1W1T3_CLAP2|nr:uncharacterized protein CPUR_00497 [Claviceps purpurea 20.1]
MTDSSVQSHSLKRKLAAQQSGDNSQSLELSDQTPPIVQPPDDPVVVFQKFCPEYLVEKWVTWTNDWVSHKINHPEDAASSNDAAGLNDVAALNDVAGLSNFAALNHFGGFNDFADADESSDEADDVSLRRWVPTCAAELYVFLAFLTYIGLHPEPNLSDYWREEPPIGLGPGWPTHRIHKFMTYRRFKLLFRNVRVFDPFDAPEDNLTQPVSRVSNWPDPVQQAAADLLQPGLKITLEEGMIRFTGRSGAEVTTPRKSIPEGLRIWALAANGHYIRWIFRLPGHRPKLQLPIEPGNASTQSVVLDLMSLSATTNRQAFFDNLLTTIELLGILREEGNVPTGTARLTTGMWDQFVRLKDVDNNPNVDWLYHALEASPTPDNLVSLIIR